MAPVAPSFWGRWRSCSRSRWRSCPEATAHTSGGERRRQGSGTSNSAGGPDMIMRITWGKLRPGSWSEFEKTYNATVAAKGGNVNGLRGRWLLQDSADKDTGFAVSL